MRTDHSRLQWLKTFKEPVGQVAWWIERLAEYDYDIKHRHCRQHTNADALSRYPFLVSAVTVVEKWFPLEFKADLVKQQARYPVTSALLAWCKKAQRLRQDQLEGESQDLWYYWARFVELTVENGVLCLRTAVND